MLTLLLYLALLNPVRFAFITDTHLALGSHSFADLRHCIKDINAQDSLDFVILGGDITDFGTQKIVATGIAMVPEGRRVFANLTVLENLRIGAYLRTDKEVIEEDINYVYDLFPRLKERSWQLAGTLSGGEQQMLAVGRAIMTRPKIIMMDEPSLGLAPLVVKDIFMIIQTLKSTGMTVLLIEQNANAALHACDYAYVMETGRITTSGTGEELLASETIQEAYLGKSNAR